MLSPFFDAAAARTSQLQVTTVFAALLQLLHLKNVRFDAVCYASQTSASAELELRILDACQALLKAECALRAGLLYVNPT